ncbi:hypothetical protein [Pseudomonas cremoricolorata]|uniref:Uncharacterized protein n=1 Tax=Pseudomonas cremoricolorata TaxID=157783 RepID=A0A089YFG6_9PSED|nr:hypothetical protein LK03_14800 [Pseudomonas cremoricolorata]
MTEKTPIKTEAELCEIFIRDMNAQPGWTCYPETGGFDILVVHEEGRQIGVEAKLALNAKVADQIMPNPWQYRYGLKGPDHRLVIVSKISDASAGIAKLLGFMGVPVLIPRHGTVRIPAGLIERVHFEDYKLRELLAGTGYFNDHDLFDWNPEERCQVPMVVPQVAAGVPSPTRLTPWKEKALRALALMRSQGFITSRQLKELGMSPTTWTQHTSTQAWLDKGPAAGQWVETVRTPAFDKQHPEAYAVAVAVASLAPKDGTQLELTA